MNTPRIESLLKLLPSQPDDPFLRYALGIEFANEGNDSGAEEYFRGVFEKFPTYVPNYLHYGMLLERQEQIDRAREIYLLGIKAADVAGDLHAKSELTGALEMLV